MVEELELTTQMAQHWLTLKLPMLSAQFSADGHQKYREENKMSTDGWMDNVEYIYNGTLSGLKKEGDSAF